MFIHFEDYTQFTWVLDKKGISHGGRIIKVFATRDDPRSIFDKPTLQSLQLSDEPLTEMDKFDFGERNIYTGSDYEIYMTNHVFTELGKRIARTLIRFASQENTGFTQAAMNAKYKDGSWLISHPLEDIDSLNKASINGKENLLHLDIFFPESLRRLKQIVDFDNPALVLSIRELAAREGKVRNKAKER